MIKKILSIVLMLISAVAGAQERTPEMADDFRANGKIYVVITVIALIFIAIVLFLVYIERKLKKLEERSGKIN